MERFIGKCLSFTKMIIHPEAVNCISLGHFLLAATILSIILLSLVYFRASYVYLVDFVCYLPPNNLGTPVAKFIKHVEICNLFDKEEMNFLQKVLERSGIGPDACMPHSLHKLPPDTSFESTREEIETVLFTVVNDLFSKHKVDPQSIDFLVSNCSLFCPTPSITSMVTNKFGFRNNIKSFNLSGMGCSAGMVSISLAKDLLRVHENTTALVLSMEAVTPNGYRGKRKSMLISNTLFRMGGAAILLSNKKKDKQRAKYKLQHLVRTHMGSNHQAYQSVFQKPDEDGYVGVSLSRDLLQVAAKALTTNISSLGPLVLPYSEQIRYGWSWITKKIWPPAKGKEVYVPNFKKAFEHFCIHAGGKAVIDAVEKSLKLQKEDGEASRMTLYRFGNTSSSSVWYELNYLEAKGKVKRGDRVWQIAFGSGFKCNSAVWKCISEIDPKAESAWSDRIHLYPVETGIPDVSS
ncbi:3-ketoacyl-CoA synthase 7 [Cucumis sativus]|uniref:3-ketoacyl-CoA synthase n=1 Tax=Cucumis sativus TaxID=3659 RepID=A0A0A0LFM2_CUCSA|nr:3-ketoacyl-CoA synthase 7 [Cucumis sativus]KGN59744.1 hypothetical protein Csa_001795 [Cucumis sativus]